LPDGQYVEKGGAAQQLRLAYLGYGGRGGIGDTNSSSINGQPARKVYTCTGTCASGSSLSAYPFEYNNAATNGAITTTAFGAADATALQTLLKWIRGQDTADENGFKVGTANTDVRPSVHGDVLHSRPIVLDFGGTTGVYVFYGGNDGMFRAIKGGQAATDGKEQWAFVPTELFGKFKRLYDNSPNVLYPSTMSTDTTATKRDYFFDGPVATYVERGSSNQITKAYLYISMRRGGRFIYAIDVTTPTDPKFLWKKSSTDAGFAELGQTWSQPMVVKVQASTDRVLIFGAGYDAASEDPEPPASADTMGRAIYVLNAYTGARLWAGGKADNFGSLPSGMSFTSAPNMNFSIAGEVLVVDRDLNGYADRIYATDVGGGLWRVDIADATPANWAVWKLATLADRGSVASTRKFLFGVDMVRGSSFDAVFLGSGDREHPLVSNAAQDVINRFYMIKDTRTGLVGTDQSVTDTCGATLNSSCTNLDDASDNVVNANAPGWLVGFSTGEKVVNRPVVIAGHILFGTNKPDLSNSMCNASLGIATRYSIAFDLTQTNITIVSAPAPGGGFLPSASVFVVTAEKTNEDGTTSTVTRVVATDNPLSPGLQTPSFSVPTTRFRTYWRELID
jgi:type IV pilus assembly protein PilY1